MGDLSLSVHAYSFDELCSLIAKLTPAASETGVKEHPHLDYLKEYFSHFEELPSRLTIVVEHDYVDRHFLEDYASYYVSCFLGKYSPVCSRLHFFSLSRAFPHEELRKAVLDAGTLTVEQLQASYLGFIVIKPLPVTFVGRTCLRTYAGDRRDYPTTRAYTSHLLGIEFKISSLAFQQQDSVVAACATSALWSIFHRTGMLFHHAIPSPAQITKTACESIWTRERGFPNRGLYPEQMAVAIKRVGLEPEMVGVTKAATLKATAYGYLRAGIPIVLNAALLDTSITDAQTGVPYLRGGHAVAVTGFSTGRQMADPHPDCGTLLRSSRIDKLYVHDDGIGPFARMSFSNRQFPMQDGTTVDFVMESSWRGEADNLRGSVVFAPEVLIIPLYHKIRIPLDAVLKEVFWLDAHIEALRQNAQALTMTQRLEWDVFLTTESAFKTSLREDQLLAQDQRLELL